MKFESTALRQSSIEEARNPLAGGPPALATHISALPNLPTVADTKPVTAAASLSSRACVHAAGLHWARMSWAAPSGSVVLWTPEAARMPSFQKGTKGGGPNPRGLPAWLAAPGVKAGTSFGD